MNTGNQTITCKSLMILSSRKSVLTNLPLYIFLHSGHFSGISCNSENSVVPSLSRTGPPLGGGCRAHLDFAPCFLAEAAYTLLLYDELLEWSDRPLREFLSYPMQTEWQRKEHLHLAIIQNFDRGKVSGLGRLCWCHCPFRLMDAVSSGGGALPFPAS